MIFLKISMRLVCVGARYTFNVSVAHMVAGTTIEFKVICFHSAVKNAAQLY